MQTFGFPKEFLKNILLLVLRKLSAACSNIYSKFYVKYFHRKRAQREKEERQREEELLAQQQREAEAAAAANQNFTAPGDQQLIKYMEEVRDRIQPLPTTRDQVVALAQCVKFFPYTELLALPC